MKTFLIAAAAVATLGAALPAAAQTWDHGYRLPEAHRTEFRYDHFGREGWARLEARRVAEQRFEWRVRHEHLRRY